jgi:hypothetical protein
MERGGKFWGLKETATRKKNQSWIIQNCWRDSLGVTIVTAVNLTVVNAVKGEPLEQQSLNS